VSAPITVAVLGGNGFIGTELVRLLSEHPAVELTFISSERHASQRVGQVMPGLRHSAVGRAELHHLADLPKVDVAIACLPTGVLPANLDAVCGQANLVLNVAGDYRLRDPGAIAAHYPDSASGWRDEIPYFVPEFAGKPSSAVVNLPGCMAVASIYALYPLFHADLVAPEVVIDAKTGSSGSGSNSVEHPAIRDGNVRIHKLHGHRHAPEVREAITSLTGRTPDLQFSTFSLPMSRGVMASAYSRLRAGVSVADVRRAYAQAYKDTPFVRVSNGRTPMSFPMLKTVVGTNLAEVGVAVEDDRCVSVVTLDNLLKGGAGQAIQALNRMHDLDESLGLPTTAAWP
jgi:N-acetyl-gamma-glutamyl-phosphate/LysW-gamma-L-alpha-aminoadipyl-6-phosphate reductase